jgi:hypothetical protein
MARVLRAIWAVLNWLFLILIPVQFYLAGHGAMEGAHSADHPKSVMTTAWDPHVAVGTIMLLVSLLIMLVAFGSQLDRRLLGMSIGLFVAMIVQFLLPLLNDSASTRWLAALHAVNALVVTGLAMGLAIRSRGFLPMSGQLAESSEAP